VKAQTHDEIGSGQLLLTRFISVLQAEYEAQVGEKKEKAICERLLQKLINICK
jgi:hypothetical protein